MTDVLQESVSHHRQKKLKKYIQYVKNPKVIKQGGNIKAAVTLKNTVFLSFFSIPIMQNAVFHPLYNRARKYAMLKLTQGVCHGNGNNRQTAPHRRRSHF